MITVKFSSKDFSNSDVQKLNYVISELSTNKLETIHHSDAVVTSSATSTTISSTSSLLVRNREAETGVFTVSNTGSFIFTVKFNKTYSKITYCNFNIVPMTDISGTPEMVTITNSGLSIRLYKQNNTVVNKVYWQAMGAL